MGRRGTTDRPIAIRCGRLLDIDTGETARDATILIDAEHVTAIARRDEGVPDEALIVDFGDLTVVPGLIDVHAHLVGDVQTAGVPGVMTSAAQDVLIGVRNARATLDAGFTTVRDVGS